MDSQTFLDDAIIHNNSIQFPQTHPYKRSPSPL